MSEKTLHRAVADYIRMAYPNVLFNSDMSGSTKLTMGQAVAMKALRSNRGFPDLVIYKQSYYMGRFHSALFIELKVEGTKLFKKDSSPATPHIEEQLECMKRLKAEGYEADFAVGFDEAKEIIDSYLK